jgi:hypothetical protein
MGSPIAGAARPQALANLVIGPPGQEALRALFERPNEWPLARSRTAALLYADHNLKDFDDRELIAWFITMRRWDLRLELEVGAVKPWGITANDTFREDRPMWDRVMRLGGPLNSIAMDEPLSATREALHRPDAYAVDQTAHFVQLVRQAYPSVLIGDIEPYPSISAKDHIDWIKALQQRLAELGVRQLDFYRLDVDWVAFRNPEHGSWSEVASLRTEIGNLGIPFSLIYWASPYPAEKARGEATDGTWTSEVMAEGAAFAKTGSSPDQYVLESWIGAPSHSVPETNPATFTGSVLAFARRYLQK